ncbi:hypothetical protein A0J61_11036 [Choanephora cucurbitarum]|uniref:Uncharacterized protein n=1 Tax=Choanephora cucurbitarum TaxID=101091 RepID=A0A1C7MVI9_9FUNG|nr:hypothetical protein A0J61_11036 [Choanephora cucurbitarum]
MEPEGYKALKSVLSQDEMNILEASQDNKYTGLSDADMQALLKILESGGKEEIDPEAIEEEILREQLRLRSLKLKNSDQYKMLDILKCMIERVDHCNENDSELTCYRHFAKLLDCLFKDTNLLLLDGEPACIAVKEEMIAGQSLYPSSSGNVLSTCAIRKIDAIIAIEQNKERVEFSTNEWKKNNASTTTAIKQQSKNLRSNLSILNQLERKFSIRTKDILAVDFVGNLEKKEGVAVATLVEEMAVPTVKSELERAPQTINALFMLKNHVLKLAEEVASKPKRSKLRGIVRCKQPLTAPCQTPRVIFSPKLKKRKLDE